MAASTDTDDDILKCPICLEVYNKPKYLPCLHTFCEPCLKSYIVSSVKQNEGDEKTKVEFNCPVCRIIVPVADQSSPPGEWASQFPNNHLIMTLLDKVKLQTKVKLCDLCRVDNNDVTAVYWCKICNEALCDFCAKFHRRMEATKQHKLFVIAEQENNSFGITRHEYCETHKEKQLEAFCFDHDKACCVTCVTINHRKCDHVTTLQDAAKDIRDKPELKELCDKLLESEKVLSAILKNAKGNLDDIQTQKLSMMKQISELRIQINKHLDDIEAKLTQEIRDFDKQFTTEIKDVVFDLENRQKVVVNYRAVLDACINQATDTHLFLEMKRLEDKQKEMEVYFKSSLKSAQRIEFEFSPLPGISSVLAINHFGTLEVKKSSIKDEVLSSVEVPHLARTFLKESLFSKSYSFSVPEADIKDAIFLPDGRIAITNKETFVYMCGDKGTDITKVNIGSGVSLYGIAIFNENEVIVSRPGYICMYIVDFQKKKATKIFDCESGYKGITIFQENIIIARDTKLLFMNFVGEVVKKIDLQPTVDNVTCGNQRLFYTNNKNHTLNCITFEGSAVFEYKHPELQVPCGVTTDEEGYIFVAGYKSSNVHQVSPEGKLVKIILSEKDGIKNPHAIYFDKRSKMLIVTYSKCHVSVYSRTW